jgi:hypothetical protein
MQTTKFLLTLCLLTAAPTWATVILNLSVPTQTAIPGQTITFGGTITNNHNDTIDLNALNITLAGMFSFDASPFFDLTAPISVSPNSTSAAYDWFTVTVADPYTDPFGPITGTITLLGGIQGPNGYDPTVQDLLATTQFTINVIAAPTANPVPEPATWPILFGLGATAAWLRRRTRAANRLVIQRGLEIP